MPRIDSPEFIAWLDHESGIDRRQEPLGGRCQACGTEQGAYPFIGGYCALCLSFEYGRFVKSQELAMWVEERLWLFQPGEINLKAAAINRLGGEGGPP